MGGGELPIRAVDRHGWVWLLGMLVVGCALETIGMSKEVEMPASQVDDTCKNVV